MLLPRTPYFVTFIIFPANCTVICSVFPSALLYTKHFITVVNNFFLIAAHSLLVTPQTIPELEGDLEVSFFCRENNNTFATDIEWLDPHHILYIPGSLSTEGNSRIYAEGSRLQITQLVRNDTGIYRCLRSNNPSDFAEGTLLVHGIRWYILLWCTPVNDHHE